MKYVLFGAGEMGIHALRFLGRKNVICFCDNKVHTGTDCLEGCPVISVNELEKYMSENSLVIITPAKARFVLEIAKQLDRMNVPYRLLEDVMASVLEQEEQIYENLNTRESFAFDKKYEYLVSYDRTADAGTINSYFWQDLWAARRIFRHPVKIHYDIGSRIDGFLAHLVSFGQKVRMIDIRPLETKIPGVDFLQSDATNLNSLPDNTVESFSALCSLEHFGLGRYGDPIDPEACFQCFEAIQKKIKTGGVLYVSVPIGKEHLEFNAHRVFYPKTIIECFSKMKLIEFSSCYKEEYMENVAVDSYDEWTEKGGERFGLFRFQKM